MGIQLLNLKQLRLLCSVMHCYAEVSMIDPYTKEKFKTQI